MGTELYLRVLFYINLVLSILNNCFVLVGLCFTIRKLVKVARKRRYIRQLGEQYGYETCQWKYIEKQLRMTLFLLLLIIELFYFLLYNAKTILQNLDSKHISNSPVKRYSNDCILSNGTYLAKEYDFTISIVSLRIMRSFQDGLFVYGLWISYIFLSHISKAMNKSIERKKLVLYSLLGSIAPVFVITISNIPVLSIFKEFIIVSVSQVTLTCGILQGFKVLILVNKVNKSLQYSYTQHSLFMAYRRWLFKQYVIVTITLTILLQIYILRDLALTGNLIGETLVKNPCWFKSTFNIQISGPNLVNRNSVETTCLLSELASRMLNIIFHAGLFSIQIYTAMCYYYKIQKKKPKRSQSMKDAYLSNSLMSDSEGNQATGGIINNSNY